MEKILFICTVNKLRSRTAETLLRENMSYEVKSAGTDPKATILLTKELLDWADRIFVMEKYHRNRIRRKFPEIYKTKQIECFYIPDDYEYMEPGLIEIFRNKFNRYFVEQK